MTSLFPDYQLGLTLVGLTHVCDIFGDIHVFPSASVPVRERYTTLDGVEHERGWLTCEWRFTYISQTHIALLRGYCPGISANVFLKTYNGEGSYIRYSAVMVWNPLPQPKTDYLSDFVITYRKMIAQ